MLKFKNLNHASLELSRLLLTEGIKRKTRGFDCIELGEPIMFGITNPHDRYVNIPGRKASKTLPFGESLALLSGVNDIQLYSDYVPNMVQYSDDGVTQRAGYGPRIRGFIGIDGDYVSFKPFEIHENYKGSVIIDQFSYVIKTLGKDPQSRQAVISITDPAVDQFGVKGELIKTKDIPCCRLLQFMVVNGKLDCTAYFRSNDVLFGFQQVNMFNNTFMQECISMIIGVPVGNYYHIANNLHYYEDKEEILLCNTESSTTFYEEGFPEWQGYQEKFTLEEFDNNLIEVFNYRKKVKEGWPIPVLFKDGFFSDWCKVFYRFHQKDKFVHFKNPYLNRLFNNRIYTPGLEYVKVLIGNEWKFYNVHKPKAYLRKCKQDNKEAYYVGRVDKFGYLNR